MTAWRRWPFATFGLVALLSAFFLVEAQAMRWGMIDDLVRDLAFVWPDFVAEPLGNAPRLISSLFLHANWSHALSNIVFVSLFGPLVERRVGAWPFLLLFLVWGAVASICQGILTSAGTLGASGAISGAAGAHFILSPMRRSVSALRKIVAVALTGLWFLLQIYGGFLSLGPELIAGAMEIAYWAHAAGFSAGALCALPFLLPENLTLWKGKR